MTPEGRELASPGSRVGARLIDFIVLAVIVAPFVLRGIDFDAGSFGSSAVSSGRLLAGGLIAAAYEIGLTGLKSATLGKMAVGIEVVRSVDEHAPIGFSAAAMRWLPFVIGYIPISILSNLSTLVFLASLILVFVDDFRRSVYDFAGQTYVVRKPRAT